MSDATTKIDIRNIPLDKLSIFLKENGEKPFRAKQIDEWLWKKSAKSFDDMTNLSLSTRDLLKKHFAINHIAVDKMQRSSDGTIKNAVKLFDDMIVESVLIPTTTRITACISSQVGCSLDCNFCATARLKRMRNLNADEIYDQVAAIIQQGEEYFDRPLTNIVYMGMGEPLLNYKNVISSIEK
ncbi:MAG: 23S rRNA (adenine(2503)-C(2))-methyltransferase RlmN, partial [Cyclobacteriaceae bacterium]|nr:23S rRNA (adenine(2503)-C(2))-methyltransferase RlmN [Cyclobacteriaceae bacterium]